ncbi:MAG: hypothetical protein AB2A00_37120 [Myxococcota bacterium]
MIRRSLPGYLLAVLVGAGASGCDVSAECLPWFKGPTCLQTDLGKPCSCDENLQKRVTVKGGSNDLVQDSAFENCESFYCASTNGSRPYCTKRCSSALDCDPGGPPCIPGQPCARDNWKCEVVIEFGSLACEAPDENGSCELDEETGKVKEPARYCRAVDGTLTDDQVQLTCGL